MTDLVMNTFGSIYRLTSFGESHGPAMGGVVDGMPSGVKIDFDEVQRYVGRRSPDRSSHSTKRREADRVEFLSGFMDGVTLGTPIGFIVRNTDAHSADYDALRNVYRPGHADYTYQMKYGIRDHRGGGRASARETVSRMVAGALAMQVLKQRGVKITAYVTSIGDVSLPEGTSVDLSLADKTAVRCPDLETASRMEKLIMSAVKSGDTLGGTVRCVMSGVPVGLGEPVFGKLDAVLASAMMSIPAVKAVGVGQGARLASQKGSEAIDRFEVGAYGDIRLRDNKCGGVLGGISTGDDIYLDVAFKPVATMMRPIESVDVDAQLVTIEPRGRHDVCVVPRAVPVVEAMAAMVLLDQLLLSRATL